MPTEVLGSEMEVSFFWPWRKSVGASTPWKIFLNVVHLWRIFLGVKCWNCLEMVTKASKLVWRNNCVFKTAAWIWVFISRPLCVFWYQLLQKVLQSLGLMFPKCLLTAYFHRSLQPWRHFLEGLHLRMQMLPIFALDFFAGFYPDGSLSL